MKRISLFFLLLLFCSLVNAQFYQIAEGPVFPDPGPGYAKILQMKNNNTMFFHINFNKGINVHVYDAQYKARTETNLEPSYGNLKAGNVEAIFEMNGDAVLMISNILTDTAFLYRLIVDGKTGDLKEEKRLSILKKPAPKKEDEKMVGGAGPSYHVYKDPGSNNYAVAMINDFISDTSKRLELVLYGADNKEIKRVNYSSREKFKYFGFIDMTIIDSNKVVAFFYGYNLKNGDKEGELILADLDKKSATMGFNELSSFPNALVIDHGITRYLSQTKQLLLLITANDKSDSSRLNNFLVFIDPFTRKFHSSIPIGAGEIVKKKYNDIFKRENYGGIAQNLFINDHGGFTVIYEEMEQGKDTVMHVALRNIAVVSYDNEGTVTGSYLIPMDHDIINQEIFPFYQSKRNTAGQYFSGEHFLQGNQYKSDIYISDGQTGFVLFNDKESNALPAANGKITQLKDIYDADGFYFKFPGKNIIPKAQYVFGKPVEKDAHVPGIFSVFDYDKTNNLLITLKVEKLGAHPGIKLVWLQPN